jgi:hypothetical protein
MMQDAEAVLISQNPFINNCLHFAENKGIHARIHPQLISGLLGTELAKSYINLTNLVLVTVYVCLTQKTKRFTNVTAIVLK